MVNYKLNEEADKDLDRLYEYGVLSFGLDQADRYYEGLIERFYELVDNPKLWQAVDHIRTGYRRSVYASHSILERNKRTKEMFKFVLEMYNSSVCQCAYPRFQQIIWSRYV